jgi:hypothetical protein
MTECTCTEVKRMVLCELNRGDGPCLTTSQPTPEPPALNSDALTNTIAAALGANITTNL